MNRLQFAARLALVVAAVLGLARSASAGEQVPFNGTLNATVTLEFLEFPGVIVRAQGNGQSTQLGTFTYFNENLVNRATMTSEGRYVFMAANGDKVFAKCTGSSTMTSAAGVLHTVEIATIKGGTGRFANASGRFVTDRLLNSIDGWTIGSFSGTISSPGAGAR